MQTTTLTDFEGREPDNTDTVLPMHEREKTKDALDPEGILADAKFQDASRKPLPLTEMAFIHPEHEEYDDRKPFPTPEEITQLTEDVGISGSTPGTEEAAAAGPMNGKFLAMDAVDVYEFLCLMQTKTGHWLNNEERQVTMQPLTQNTEKLSNADKQTIILWEKERRMKAGEWNPEPGQGRGGWQDRPNA